MEKVFQGIADFVNKCLGPLASGGFSGETVRDLVVQLLATLILFLVVKKFLWGRITALLDARKKELDGEITTAKEANENAHALERKLALEYENSKIKIQKLINDAVKEGNTLREEIISEAKVEAARRIENASAEIELEVKKQKDAIKEEIISIAFAAAEKIVEKEIDQAKHLKVVTDLIEGSK